MRSLTEDELVAHNMDVLVHGCDAEGAYLGLVPPGPGVTIVSAPPPPGIWHWVGGGGGWVRTIPLAEAKVDAKDQIDRAAGEARLRYITDVPGQQGTYIKKAEEARQYLAAGCEGPAPPYVAAEAAATGLSPAVAAETIAGISALWEGTIGPGIEMVRIGSKRSIDQATTHAAVESILTNALGQLAEL